MSSTWMRSRSIEPSPFTTRRRPSRPARQDAWNHPGLIQMQEDYSKPTMPPWAAGDEVYGRSGPLRQHLEDHQIGYVLRVGAALHLRLPRAQQAIDPRMDTTRAAPFYNYQQL